MDSLNDLLRVIASHPSITDIHFNNCFGNNIFDALQSIFATDKPLNTIDVERNDIHTIGQTSIPDFLAANPPVKVLCLANNMLKDEDVVLIANALKRNTQLQELTIFGGEVTKVGVDAILDVLYDPSSFNSVSDCNHSCVVYGIEEFDFYPAEEYSYYHLHLHNGDDGMGDDLDAHNQRALKIYHLLSVRNRELSNVQCLDAEVKEETLKLVPGVLACVHHYSQAEPRCDEDPIRVHPLSIMFEIVRSWKMPSLFESCGAS